MKNLKTSTWILIGLVVVTGALVTTLLVLRPDDFHHSWQEERSTFRHLHSEKLDELTEDQLKQLKRGAGRFGFHPGARWGRHRGGGLLFLLLVAGGITLVIVAVRRRSPQRKDASSAILEEQYAEGKINEEELRRKRAVLREEGEEA